MNANFITAVDVASKLKISKALAYRLITTGEIASIRFGRTVRVREEDLNAFIAHKFSASANHSQRHIEAGVSEH